MDANSSAYFDSLSQQWSEKYAAGGNLRHRVDRCLAPIRDCLQPGSKVLDFGCGTGQITLALRRAGLDVCGFDTSPGMIAVARKLCAEAGVEFMTGGSNGRSAIPAPDRAFRGVVASSVLEYADDPQAQLDELARVLAPGGVLVMTVPNPLNRRRKLERALGPIVRSRLSAPILGLPNERVKAYWKYLSLSVNHFGLDRWTAMLVQSGFRVDNVSTDGAPLTMIVAVKTAD
jgi:ubiquinone/menaquinone biosynthesis C-methylase UbiE